MSDDSGDSLYRASTSPPRASLFPLRSPPPPPRPLGSPHPGAFRPRYAGDGLDFRRPVMSSTAEDNPRDAVIDLTEDDEFPIEVTDSPALPRRTSVSFAREPRRSGLRFEVVDLEGEGHLDRPDHGLTHSSFDSPHAVVIDDDAPEEVTITQWNQRVPDSEPPRRWPPPRNPSNRDLPARIARHHGTHNRARHWTELTGPPHSSITSGITTGINNFHNLENTPFPHNILPPLRNFSSSNPSSNMGQNPSVTDPHNHTHFPYLGPNAESEASSRRLPPLNVGPAGGTSLRIPHVLDFTTTGFDLGGWGSVPHSHRHDRDDTDSTVALDELAPVREGFTRDPREGDELVCPNCEEELCRPGSGNAGDGDENAQVWVVRACGHVYCGRCKATTTARVPTVRRSTARATKGKGKGRATEKDVEKDADDSSSQASVKPLKQCVVEGCGVKTVGKSAMFPLYL
ncbi:MAG: hypothetical protein M1828_005447 [Chrysothrix sp. TS-e1954]|nr:MAG: hypothetical protein M1828_005447 [Chrysothrix sp. TS-e1954]